MKNPRCIAISGIDGSGKTTLAYWLVKYLRSKGYRAKYVWIKSKHTFAYLISQILEPLGWQQTFRNPNGIIVSRFELYDSRFARKAWPTIEFLSVLPLIIFKVQLPLLLGYRIVLDRYMIDTVTSIALSTKNMKFADSFLGRLLLKMMPKGCASILLDIDLSMVLERRPDIEYSYDEIRNAIGLYRTLTRKMKSVSLDTDTLTVEQTKKRVLELLFVTELMPKVPIERTITLDFSIVIPTVNRAMKLKALLESILGQEFLPKEITIMDQSDNRLTFNIVNEMKQSFLDRKILLRYFHINQKSSSKARNLGIDHSTAEIVFFIDDDVILSTDYTKNILKVYEGFSDAVGVQGIILNPEPSGNLTSIAGRLENQLKKVFFLSHYQENTWTIMPSINDAFSFPLTTVASTQRMQGCCSFRRKLLDIFRYDENLEGWSFLEDFDLSYRIYKSNIGSLYITPEAKIIHKEHIHMSYSLKNESYKKIVNRTYMFFKLIKQTPRNCAIFCWSILGFLLTTTLGTILGRKKEKNRWIPIYLIEAAFYSLRHLKEIRQLNLSFLSNSSNAH
jgi:GT2 family glycosyltransferase